MSDADVKEYLKKLRSLAGGRRSQGSMLIQPDLKFSYHPYKTCDFRQKLLISS